MKFPLRLLFLLCLSPSLMGFLPFVDSSGGKKTAYAFQWLAFAPNAGGQAAYAARIGNDAYEWSLFSNSYLQTGPLPLSGILLSKRYTLCGQECFWQVYAQIGAGLSTAGPAVEFLWGTIPLWVFRIDFATHMYITQKRAITWSYPLWVGLTYAF